MLLVMIARHNFKWFNIFIILIKVNIHMLLYCWANVVDSGPAFKQYWVAVLGLLVSPYHWQKA